MSPPVRLSHLSVTFVPTTEAIEIFGNVYTQFGRPTLAICRYPAKIFTEMFQGNPFVGGVKHKCGIRL